MDSRLNILVIGATGGIGKAITNVLKKESNNLILVAKDSEALQKLAVDIPHCTTYSIDLENFAERSEFCSKLTGEFEKIDWIIHAAGFITKEDSTANFNENVIKKTFEINYFAPAHITQRLSSKIKPYGGSIFISSTAGMSGNGFVPAYASSKGALNSFARSLALSWQDTLKRSIIVSPGPTNTKMREDLANDSAQHQSPLVIANLVEKIISEATNYANGSNLIVRDGKISFESK